jgi:hypothetical protein
LPLSTSAAADSARSDGSEDYIEEIEAATRRGDTSRG